MEFVQGLPKGVYVGQTCIEHPQAIATPNQNLKGLIWLCMLMMMHSEFSNIA
jgi:hypothetical protein